MQNYPEGEFDLPLFPLPNVVFFPKTRLPLHVFEERYRRMVADASGGEKRIGVILLREGWEEDYLGAPAVHQFGTLGTIEHIVELVDGRYNILLNGEVRFRVVGQVQESPYRIARVIAEPENEGAVEEAYALREWLLELSRRYLEFMPGPNEVPELERVSFDELANALVMSLSIDAQEKQKLLEMNDMITRADRIGTLLEERLKTMGFLAPFRQDGDPKNN